MNNRYLWRFTIKGAVEMINIWLHASKLLADIVLFLAIFFFERTQFCSCCINLALDVLKYRLFCYASFPDFVDRRKGSNSRFDRYPKNISKKLLT